MANKSAKKALEQFKMQAASEVGVTLNQNGYNGNLTSKQAGSIGGQMVKKMTPKRTSKYDRENRIVDSHKTDVEFTYSLGLS